MRQAATRGLLTVMATGSVLASTAGYVYADASAVGSAADSPGVGSGNAVQVPVSVPVNVCGNTVNVIGLLNPAMGNNCKNVSHHSDAGSVGSGSSSSTGSGPGANGGHDSGSGSTGGHETGGSGPTGGGSTATGGSHGSPGVGSGNTGQIPVSLPVNACGDSVDIIGALNPAFGDHCANHSAPSVPAHCPPPSKPTPPVHCPPPVKHQSPPPPVTVLPASAPVAHPAVLAETGASDDLDVLVPAAAALVLGGGVLYRRSRAGQR